MFNSYNQQIKYTLEQFCILDVLAFNVKVHNTSLVHFFLNPNIIHLQVSMAHQEKGEEEMRDMWGRGMMASSFQQLRIKLYVRNVKCMRMY